MSQQCWNPVLRWKSSLRIISCNVALISKTTTRHVQHSFWYTSLPSLQTTKKFRDLIFRFSFLFLFVVVVCDITSTTICCSSGREIVVVLSQGFVVKRSINSSERKSSLRLRSHLQDEFSASWKFMRLGVLFTRNHLNRTKVLVAIQSFLWKEQNYWTIPCEWGFRSNFSADRKFVRKWTAPGNSHFHAHTLRTYELIDVSADHK